MNIVSDPRPEIHDQPVEHVCENIVDELTVVGLLNDLVPYSTYTVRLTVQLQTSHLRG